MLSRIARTLLTVAAAGALSLLAQPEGPALASAPTYIFLTFSGNLQTSMWYDGVVGGSVFTDGPPQIGNWSPERAGHVQDGPTYSPFSNHSLDAQYKGDPIFTFHDSSGTGNCINHSADTVDAETDCSSNSALWVLDNWQCSSNEYSGHLINVGRTQSTGKGEAASTQGDGYNLDVTLALEGISGRWYEWSFGINNCSG